MTAAGRLFPCCEWWGKSCTGEPVHTLYAIVDLDGAEHVEVGRFCPRHIEPAWRKADALGLRAWYERPCL